ncbi:MAG: protein-S-isoprenylcysteine O-methyltransferase, partial [Bacteroidota bacterium]
VPKILFFAFWLCTWVIRYPFHKRNKENKITTSHKTRQEKWLLFLTGLGMIIVPVLYLITPAFSFADYTPTYYMVIPGVLLTIPVLWLFYRSHRDLGRNWSATLEVREDHSLITGGIYAKIRHPMYTAIWGWVIIQALLLPNYVAGAAGILGFGLLYALRVGQEEQMMAQQFGGAYRRYMQITGRLLPKF